jgi:DNA invertase Pin-like site-specific DNA recombinase
MQKTVAVNDAGLRIGEDHPNSKLTDAEVELIRSLHESGMSYATLAEKFEVSRWTIGRICRYERRGQIPARFKAVHVPDCG